MWVRLQDQQLDLLRRAGVFADREKLPAEVRGTVVVLLKQLLSECVPGVAKTRTADE